MMTVIPTQEGAAKDTYLCGRQWNSALAHAEEFYTAGAALKFLP